MAAGVGDGELVVGVELLAGVDGEDGGFAVVQLHAAAVGVEDEFGVDQVAVVLDQPVDAVRLAALFIGGEREDDVAVRTEAFALQAEEGLDQDGVGLLHVLGAAAVEVAVFLGDELEGIGGPVVAARFDDVEMADEQDGLLAACAVVAHDEVLLAVVGAEQLHVRGGKAGVEETLLHGFGRGGDAADRVGGVDLDELAEDIDGFFVDWRPVAWVRARGASIEQVKNIQNRSNDEAESASSHQESEGTRFGGTGLPWASLLVTQGNCTARHAAAGGIAGREPPWLG